MAEADEHEKTEDPSQKKLSDARDKGTVAKSQEVNSWFMILAAALMLMTLSQDMASSLAHTLKGVIANSHDIPMDGLALKELASKLALAVLGALALPFILMVIAGISTNVLQHGFLLTIEPIKPKLSKISPLAGFKRLFSATSLVNFVKGVAKLVIVSTIIAIIIWPERDTLEAIVSMDPASLLLLVQTLAGKIFIGVLAIMTVLAAADYAYQRYQWWQKQRMTIQELKDEYKQMEGDPQVRAKLRQVRIERGRKRMMANVSDATVVITNPTHYSVALQYEEGMIAPICVGKGVDKLALKIREVAQEHEIPLVENPPLARALYDSIEVDDEIPADHYKAVAEVIGYVLRLRNKGR